MTCWYSFAHINLIHIFSVSALSNVTRTTYCHLLEENKQTNKHMYFLSQNIIIYFKYCRYTFNSGKTAYTLSLMNVI